MASFGEAIHDRKSAERFIEWCVREIGVGFHPDTQFSDYVKVGTGEAAFTHEESLRLDSLLDQAFRFCDPYEIGLAAQRRALGMLDGLDSDSSSA